LGPVQRRDFVRVPDRLPVRFRLDDGQDSVRPWWAGITRDISGGGAKIISPVSRNLKNGDFVETHGRQGARSKSVVGAYQRRQFDGIWGPVCGDRSGGPAENCPTRAEETSSHDGGL
jgi:hypothetical protein